MPTETKTDPLAGKAICGNCSFCWPEEKLKTAPDDWFIDAITNGEPGESIVIPAGFCPQCHVPCYLPDPIEPAPISPCILTLLGEVLTYAETEEESQHELVRGERPGSPEFIDYKELALACTETLDKARELLGR